MANPAWEPYLKTVYAKAGVPEAVPLAIIGTESGFNSNPPHNNEGRGLFQISSAYYGKSYTEAQREDPKAAIDITFPHIVAAWRRALQLGYTGTQAEDYTASHSGFNMALPLSDTRAEPAGWYNQGSPPSRYRLDAYFNEASGAGQSGGSVPVLGGIGQFFGGIGNDVGSGVQATKDTAQAVADLPGAVAALPGQLTQGAAGVAQGIGHAILPWLILIGAFLAVSIIFLNSLKGSGATLQEGSSAAPVSYGNSGSAAALRQPVNPGTVRAMDRFQELSVA